MSYTLEDQLGVCRTIQAGTAGLGSKRVSDRQFVVLIPATRLEESDDSYSDEDLAKSTKNWYVEYDPERRTCN